MPYMSSSISTNGTPASPAKSTSSVKRYSMRTSSTNNSNEASYHVRETAQSLERKAVAELGVGVFESVSTTSFVQLVEYIGKERLQSLPHKGSKWDKVLIRALYFAEQQHKFEVIVKNFGAESNAAANIGYGFCKLLLELGHENASALETAFGILYRQALGVSALLHRTEVVATSPEIREQLCLIYGDLISLTSAVATRYYKAVRGMGTTTVSLDINEICGSVLRSIQDRQYEIGRLIWRHQADIEGFNIEQGVSPNTLQRWLSVNDRVVTSLSQDHTSYLGGQADLTGLWFQKPLSAFIQGDNKVMAVTGPAGSGKSVLAASAVERLQRSLGRQHFSTLFHSISSSMPSAATSVHVLKSLLSQILRLRLGNIRTYMAIAHAYEKCQSAADTATYENHLWAALEDALQKPLDNARDLIVVVDGLDELQVGKAEAQAFFERLAETVSDGKRVKLIALAQTLSMPSGLKTTHIALTPDQLRDDIHAVALKNLMRCRSLTSKAGPEQEQILNRLQRASEGSFVWVDLATQWIASLTSPEDFGKAVDNVTNAKVPAQELVQRLVTARELPAATKTVLAWILSAERPLSVTDVETLLQQGQADRSDVHATLDVLKTLLHYEDGIIRFKHPSIGHVVGILADAGKVAVPQERRQNDLLLRSLEYARVALREETEPTLDGYDADIVEGWLTGHPLLSYVLNYWIIHVRKIPEQKRPNLTKVHPQTALFPLMENTLWSQALPLPQQLDLSKTALQLRQTTLQQGDPALLQSMINTAVIYETVGRPIDATSLYYRITKISQDVLGHYHPLPVQMGYRYLHISGDHLDSTRTEKMTHREEIYKILITIMERQYGKTSTQVIEMRTQLAVLYEHIKEEAQAAAIYQSLHHDSKQTHGKGSSHARNLSDRLVVLGKSTHDKAVQQHDTIFDEDEDEEEDDTFDITTVNRYLQNAKTEKDYVWLWQKLSTLCRTTSNLEYHEKNIDLALAYSKFLTSQKRSQDSVAVLSSVAREYRSNSVAFSETMCQKLIQVASYMHSVGEYAAALSVFKQTESVYRSLGKIESHFFLEIQQQITAVTTELIEKNGTESHGDILEELFRASIKNDRRVVDAKLMSIGMKLVDQRMKSSRTAEALEIIQLILHRTWPKFLSAPASEIEMTTSFPKESIDLVKRMAECYSRERRSFDNVEITLNKLFHAIIASPSVDFALLNEVESLLIEHYDRNNKFEKSITVLQKSLPVRKKGLAPDHADTIKTLYDLGSRSHARARLYPFWIDYYQQIVTILNKDATICHAKAMEAAVIVANSYWEDRRYSDAEPVFTILWRTFIQKPKEYPRYSKTDFVEQLYSRYYQSLEQIGTKFETLYQITKQYRTTCVTVFGAKASITTEATLTLARVCHSSESHNSEALDLYEDAWQNSDDKSAARFEMKHALTTLYSRQVFSSYSSSEVTTENVERARVRSLELYQASYSQSGHADQTTLSHLHELVLLYSKQKKTEAITKELTTASVEVIKQATSSMKMTEAAESIMKSFQATSTLEYCSKLLVELRRQVVTKDASNVAPFGFDLTNYGRAVLPFIATMELWLTKDKDATFSQIMADLTLEMVYYEDYRQLVRSNASLKVILQAASHLRAFLSRMNKQSNYLDEEMGTLFVARDGSKMKLISKASPRIFMQAMMEYLGTHRKSSFTKAIILGSNTRLNHLMATEQYAEAYDVASIAFHFALENNGYSGPGGISYGFKLASTVAGVGLPKKCSDNNLRARMLQLSNEIAKKIIDVCKKQHINFAEVQVAELNRLVILLGEQEDYETLEWLLTTLWSTREAQRTWGSDILYNLGQKLISARFLAGHPVKALRLCEDITYNMRRTHGTADPLTREMNALLAQLYTSVGQWYLQTDPRDKNNVDLANTYFAKAIAVHEETLHYFVDIDGDGVLGDDEDFDSTVAILAENGLTLSNGTNGVNGNGHTRSAAEEGAGAKKHLQLLKLAYQRLGSWPKSHTEYERLVKQVQHDFPSETKDVQPIDKWQVKGFGNGKAESEEGVFKHGSWRLMETSAA